MSMDNKTPIEYLTRLRENISRTFDLPELRILAFDLGIDLDNFEGGKKAKIQGLIEYLESRSRIPDLIQQLNKLRPKEAWDSIPLAQPKALKPDKKSQPSVSDENDNMENEQTKIGKMGEREAKYFTGREEQINPFERMLEAIKHGFATPYDNDEKTNIVIFGEGGMGKTQLLQEFRRRCESKEINSIFIDLQQIDEPINTLVDIMRVFRRRFGISSVKRTLGIEPFTDFDTAFNRVVILERDIKTSETEKEKSSSNIDMMSETYPPSTKGLGLKPQDLEFYLSHEDLLIEKFIHGVINYTEGKPFVILIDTYEKVMDLDIQFREKILQNFLAKTVLVFAGRKSIYDNCDPNWRDETHFLMNYVNLTYRKRKLV